MATATVITAGNFRWLTSLNPPHLQLDFTLEPSSKYEVQGWTGSAWIRLQEITTGTEQPGSWIGQVRVGPGALPLQLVKIT